MIIYEVHYNNGEAYEDNYSQFFYYETLAEAQSKYDAIDKNYDDGISWDNSNAQIWLNTLELGTQARTEVAHKHLNPYKPKQTCLVSQKALDNALAALREKLGR